MANTLHVFTDHDRHKVLMDLARKTTDHLNNNPHPNDYPIDEVYQTPTNQGVTSGK